VTAGEPAGVENPKPASGKLGAIFLTVFIDLLGFGLVMPLLPRYAETLHATPFAVGLLGASYSLMQFIFVPVWGRLSDRVGRRPVLIGSILATIGSMLILGFANSLVWLFVARIFGGIATANIATAQAYIADTTTKEARARGMGLIGMAFGIGFVIGPFFGGILSQHDLGLPAKVAAGLGLVNLIWAWRSLPESLSAEVRARVSKEESRFRLGLDFETLRRAMSVPGLGVTIVLFFVVVASFSNLEQTFALFSHDEFRLDARGTGYILGAVGLVGATVQGGMIGPLNKRFGEIALIRAGTFVQSIAMACIALSARYGLGALYASSCLLAFGQGLTNPSLSSLASKRAPVEMQGGALGVMQSMGALARVIGPTWGGFVYGLGHRLPYVTASVGLGAACLLALTLHRREPAPSVAE
jgi:DHA1 family tetracycline resistance protein-like MFS transporter